MSWSGTGYGFKNKFWGYHQHQKLTRIKQLKTWNRTSKVVAVRVRAGGRTKRPYAGPRAVHRKHAGYMIAPHAKLTTFSPFSGCFLPGYPPAGMPLQVQVEPIDGRVMIGQESAYISCSLCQTNMREMQREAGLQQFVGIVLPKVSVSLAALATSTQTQANTRMEKMSCSLDMDGQLLRMRENVLGRIVGGTQNARPTNNRGVGDFRVPETLAKDKIRGGSVYEADQLKCGCYFKAGPECREKWRRIQDA